MKSKVSQFYESVEYHNDVVDGVDALGWDVASFLENDIDIIYGVRLMNGDVFQLLGNGAEHLNSRGELLGIFRATT